MDVTINRQSYTYTKNDKLPQKKLMQGSAMDGQVSPQPPTAPATTTETENLAQATRIRNAMANFEKNSRNPFTFISRQQPPTLDLATEIGKAGWDQWRYTYKSHEIRVGLTDLLESPTSDVTTYTAEQLKAKKLEKRHAELTAAMTPETVKIVQSLGLTAEDAKDPDKIIAKMADYIEGGINIRTYRRQLGLTVRRKGESPEDFLMRIQQIAEKCKFSRPESELHASQERQLDQFLQGMADSEIQKELIKLNDKLTLSGALSTSNAIWAARKDVNTMAGLSIQPAAAAAAAAATSTSRGSGWRNRDRNPNRPNWDNGPAGGGEKCRNCNWPKHERGDQCRATPQRCDACGETGHYANSQACNGKRRMKKRRP